MSAMEAISLNRYILFVHGFWKRIAETEVLSFRNALLYNFIIITGVYLGFKGLIEVSYSYVIFLLFTKFI